VLAIFVRYRMWSMLVRSLGRTPTCYVERDDTSSRKVHPRRHSDVERCRRGVKRLHRVGQRSGRHSGHHVEHKQPLLDDKIHLAALLQCVSSTCEGVLASSNLVSIVVAVAEDASRRASINSPPDVVCDCSPDDYVARP
jgi:hypothetical protein